MSKPLFKTKNRQIYKKKTRTIQVKTKTTKFCRQAQLNRNNTNK